MGYFTWTLANKKLAKTKSGDYSAKCVLRYGGYGVVVCPDNTLIKEPCYEGYGVFDGKDVYELVVDWNKNYLLTIPLKEGFRRDSDTGIELRLLTAYANDDKAELEAAIEEAAKTFPCIREDWKRWIGIFIACYNNAILPYPIKIVDCEHPKPYAELQPSISTQ